jgi:hypothetical protein
MMWDKIYPLTYELICFTFFFFVCACVGSSFPYQFIIDMGLSPLGLIDMGLSPLGLKQEKEGTNYKDINGKRSRS